MRFRKYSLEGKLPLLYGHISPGALYSPGAFPVYAWKNPEIFFSIIFKSTGHHVWI